MLANGLDPSAQKRVAKFAARAQNAITFSTIADELLELKRREGKAPATIVKLEWLFRLAKPALGMRPISAIEAPRSCRCHAVSRPETRWKPLDASGR